MYAYTSTSMQIYQSVCSLLYSGGLKQKSASKVRKLYFEGCLKVLFISTNVPRELKCKGEFVCTKKIPGVSSNFDQLCSVSTTGGHNLFYYPFSFHSSPTKLQISYTKVAVGPYSSFPSPFSLDIHICIHTFSFCRSLKSLWFHLASVKTAEHTNV